ncbi:MAG: comEC [Ilumatobacteraceae bacterium]|nr:comEC [Ilumatobacteraceae bacterium]
MPNAAATPSHTPALGHAHSRQKSRHVATGERVARRAAITPITSHSTALARIACAYTPDPVASGAPAARRPGAANSASANPATPRLVDVLPWSNSSARSPITVGGSSPTNGPSRRTLARYARGPPRTGLAEEVACMSAAYGVRGAADRHPLPDAALAVVAIAMTLAVWSGSWPVGLVIAGSAAIVLAVRWRSSTAAAACALLVLGGVGLSRHAWSQAQPRVLGPYRGWVEVVGDPAPFGAALRVTFEVDGQRFDAWTYGSAKRRLAARHSGDLVWISGTRRRSGSNERRAQIRHVVGRMEVDYAGDVAPGSALDRASTRVRDALQSSAREAMPAAEAALFTGLVIGDDSNEPPAMVQGFRDAGLSHLTAVSGENLVFLLAAASPLLKRLRPWLRWAASVALIGWFMALTRFEPSVLRAGVMAMLAVSSFAFGRRQHPVRLLAIAVILLEVVDPLLVWSVGFWLSVGATAGVCVVGPWLAVRLRGPPWWRIGLATALGAQVGVVVPSVLVFHRLPILSVPANLLAVPVAAVVMLWGIPAGISAAFLPHALARLVMWPAAIGTRWVATIAALGARLEPAPRWSPAGWAVIAGITALLLRAQPRIACSVSADGAK